MNSKQVISSKEFQDFLKSCRNYCDLLESNNKNDSNDMVELQRALLELYSNGVNLQTIDLDSNRDFKEKLDNKEFEMVKNRTSILLGENQSYRTIFNPIENIFGNEPPVMGGLLDDIMNIDKDIKYQLKFLS